MTERIVIFCAEILFEDQFVQRVMVHGSSTREKTPALYANIEPNSSFNV